LEKQFETRASDKPRIVNLGGGSENAMSLAQLSKWCRARFGSHQVTSDATPRPFDVPWLVMDSCLAGKLWDWRPRKRLEAILEEIAQHAEAHPKWLETSATVN
jgi:CDP-paratose 2-epimerase